MPLSSTKQRIIEQNKYRPIHPLIEQRPYLPGTGMTIKYSGDRVLTSNTCVVID